MVTVITAALSLVLLAVGACLLAMGGVGAVVSKMSPAVKLSAFAGVLVLAASAGWTLGLLVPSPAAPPSPSAPPPAVVTTTGGHGAGHGG